MTDRYVVARHCNAGIGDHLSCLIGSWWLAKRTGRTLVVDWRGSRFNPDATMQRNCFFEFFKRRSEIDGVPIIADDGVGAVSYPSPLWPEKWSDEAVRSSLHLSHTANEIVSINNLVSSDADAAQPTVLINQFVNPTPPRQAISGFLRDLECADWIKLEADAFWRANVDPNPAIAIHIRHGNGENVGERSAYWLGPIALTKQLRANARSDIHSKSIFGRFNDNMVDSAVGSPGQAHAARRFCRSVAQEVSAFKERPGNKNSAVILFCDSAQAIDAMKREIPDLVTYQKYLASVGGGPLHQTNGTPIAFRITKDMFVELELMKRCERLLYMDSGFSILARAHLNDGNILRLRPTFVNRIVLRLASKF